MIHILRTVKGSKTTTPWNILNTNWPLVQNGVDVGIRDGAGRTALESTTSRQIQRLLILELMRRDNDYYENPHDIISDHFRDHVPNAGRFDNDNLKESKKTKNKAAKIKKKQRKDKERKTEHQRPKKLRRCPRRQGIIDTRNTLKKIIQIL